MPPKRLMIGLATLAAIIYNSWPLGYVLNPSVAHLGLASVLEASGQPYNWLFIAGDFTSSAVVIILAIWLWQRYHYVTQPFLLFSLIGLAIFAALTIVSTLIPLNCGVQLARCGIEAKQAFGWHDLTGGIAALGLFFGLVFSWKMATTQHLSRAITMANTLITLAWCLCGLIFLWATLANRYTIPMQDLFVALSGIGFIIITLSITKLTDQLPQNRRIIKL